jgi:hypothetical protein
MLGPVHTRHHALVKPMTTVNAHATYAIDAGGTIVAVDDAFRALADEHGQPDLCDFAVGRPLTEFVAGSRPRALQASLIERAHRSARALDLRYRCDAPEERRFAVLRIEPRPDGGTVFTTWFESVEERERQPLLDYDLPRADRQVWLCAWCNRFDVGGWREAEDAQERLESALGPLPRVEHSVCDICELLLTQRPGGG